MLIQTHLTITAATTIVVSTDSTAIRALVPDVSGKKSVSTVPTLTLQALVGMPRY